MIKIYAKGWKKRKNAFCKRASWGTFLQKSPSNSSKNLKEIFFNLNVRCYARPHVCFKFWFSGVGDAFLFVGRGFISRRKQNKSRYSLRYDADTCFGNTNFSLPHSHIVRLNWKAFGGRQAPALPNLWCCLTDKLQFADRYMRGDKGYGILFL